MKKFLAGSAIASIFTTDGKLIGISNTQINNTINLSVESQEVRSGQGNALDYIYYHSSSLEGSLEDAQFNLDYIKHNIGAKENRESSVYKSVNCSLVAGTNTIAAEGLVGNFVWAYYDDKAYTFAAEYNDGAITFTNESELSGVNVCIKYLASESGENIRNLTIDANMIPDVVSIVLEAGLFASESGAANSSRIGTVQFRIPRAQLSGTQEISLSASGVASTPLSYMALKADDATANACASATGVYGYITEILETESVKWYRGIKQLAIAADNDGLDIANGDQILVYAVGAEESFIIRPTNRIAYGYKASGESSITWITPDIDDAPISVNGVIVNATALDGATLYVKVSEDATIDGDTAVLHA